jgi:transcriptional regulator of heat shock response
VDQREAVEAERRLREMLEENSMGWVVGQVDEAIRVGKPAQKEATTLKEYYDEEGASGFSWDREFVARGKTKLIAIEEYSMRERVELLMEATEQATVVSTVMANEAIRSLSDLLTLRTKQAQHRVLVKFATPQKPLEWL